MSLIGVRRTAMAIAPPADPVPLASRAISPENGRSRAAAMRLHAPRKPIQVEVTVWRSGTVRAARK
jgi:hypothetical protein